MLNVTDGLPAIAAAAAAAAEAAATTAAAAAARAAGFVFGLVHLDGAAVELFAVHARDGVLSASIVAERNEAEATGATGVAILNDFRFINVAETLERLTK